MSIVIQRTGNLVTAIHLSCLVISQQPGSLDRLFQKDRWTASVLKMVILLFGILVLVFADNDCPG